MHNIELTAAELNMLIEALGTWSAEISAQRYETNKERIQSVQLKLGRALRPFGA